MTRARLDGDHDGTTIIEGEPAGWLAGGVPADYLDGTLALKPYGGLDYAGGTVALLSITYPDRIVAYIEMNRDSLTRLVDGINRILDA